jgi:type VI secretion system protein ImpF
MAELGPNDRLLPCLLDRLTDDDPSSATESRQDRAISLGQYKQMVLRDLQWLFNARCRPGATDLRSQRGKATVLDYGIPDLCGMTAAGVSVYDIEQQILGAILAFEPRVIPETLTVRTVVSDDGAGERGLSFEVTGHLWAEPMPEELYVKTLLDLGTGRWDVKDKPNG